MINWEVSGCRRSLNVVSNLIYLGLPFIWLCIFYSKGLCFFALPLGGKTVIVEFVFLGLKFGSQSRVIPQRTKKVSWGKDVRLARPPLPLQLQLNITHSQIFHTNKYTGKYTQTKTSGTPAHHPYTNKCTQTHTHWGSLLQAGGGHPQGTAIN